MSLRFLLSVALLSTALSIAAAVFGYRHLSHAALLAQGATRNTAFAETLQIVLREQLGPYLETAAGLKGESIERHPQLRRMQAAVSTITQGTPVHGVVIFDAKGRIVFATEASWMGRSFAHDPAFAGAARGTSSSVLLAGEASRRGTVAGRDGVFSAIPLKIAGKASGVVSIVEDQTHALRGVEVAMQMCGLGSLVINMLTFGLLLAGQRTGSTRPKRAVSASGRADRHASAPRTERTARAERPERAERAKPAVKPPHPFERENSLPAAAVQPVAAPVAGEINAATIDAAIAALGPNSKGPSSKELVTRQTDRTAVIEIIQTGLQRSRGSDQQLAVMLIDLDRFRLINESLGHEAGDTLLAEIENRLRTNLRPHDTVARLAVDEFVVCLPQVDNTETVGAIARRLLAAIEQEVELAGDVVHPAATIGVAMYPADAADGRTLLRFAGNASSHAKHHKRGNYQFFSAQMDSDAAERLDIESGLRAALSSSELMLYYQPIVRLSTRTVVGAEALLRWKHPERGLVVPDAFIAIAEETGLIIPIGEWVLREACHAASRWAKQQPEALFVSVNLSARQFEKPRQLVNATKEALEEAALPPSLLELEVTEALITRDSDVTRHVLKELHAGGIHLTVDNFGSGFSNLSQLKRYPLSSIKIDRAFIRDLPASTEDVAIVSALVAMANSLGLDVTAKGMESMDQMQYLQDIGCTYAQGYALGRPMAEEEFSQLLMNHRRREMQETIRRADLAIPA